MGKNEKPFTVPKHFEIQGALLTGAVSRLLIRGARIATSRRCGRFKNGYFRENRPLNSVGGFDHDSQNVKRGYLRRWGTLHRGNSPFPRRSIRCSTFTLCLRTRSSLVSSNFRFATTFSGSLRPPGFNDMQFSGSRVLISIEPSKECTSTFSVELAHGNSPRWRTRTEHETLSECHWMYAINSGGGCYIFDAQPFLRSSCSPSLVMSRRF